MGEVAYELPEKEMVHIPDFFTRISEEEIQVTRYAVEVIKNNITIKLTILDILSLFFISILLKK